MLQELPKEKYNLLYGIKEFSLFPMIASVIYQVQTGKIYVDSIEEPKVIYVVHKSGFSYLYEGASVDYSAFIRFLYDNDFTPQYSHIYNASDALVEAAQKETIVNLKIRKKMRMNGEPDLTKFPYPELNGYTVKSVDQVQLKDLEAFNLDFINKFWDSVDDFIKKGFGWVIFDGDKPACIWYAVAVVNGNCESDLLTLPDFRGKGLASIAGVYVIHTCAEKGINMDWDVLTDNVPSIKIAERYGKKEYLTYNFLSVFKNK